MICVYVELCGPTDKQRTQRVTRQIRYEYDTSTVTHLSWSRYYGAARQHAGNPAVTRSDAEAVSECIVSRQGGYSAKGVVEVEAE